MVEEGYITPSLSPQIYYSFLHKLCEEINSVKKLGFSHKYYRDLRVHDILWAMAITEEKVWFEI